MKSLSSVEGRKELDRKFEGVKSNVLKLIQGGYKGTIVDFMKKLNYNNELIVGCILAELEYERKASIVGRKNVYDGQEGRIGSPIYMGIYGPPKKKS